MVLTIVTFFLVLSLLVFVHELGHFWVSRKFGVKAEEFGFGFPPRAIGIQKISGEKLETIAETEKIEVSVVDNKISEQAEVIKEVVTDKISSIERLVPFSYWRVIKSKAEPEVPVGMKGDTIYSLNWLPLGGFVKIKGEDGDGSDDRDSFASRPIWQRATILLAGVSMNVVLAMFLISIGFMVGLPQVIDGIDPAAKISDRQIQVVEILPESPAQAADLKVGDIVVGINGAAVGSSVEMQKLTADNNGKPLTYKIKRGQEELEKKITPVTIKETNTGGIGIGIAETGIVKYPFFKAIGQGVKSTFILTWAILVAFYELFKNLLTGQGVSADLSGPVGIAVLTGQVAQMGFIYVLQFTAMLSINLAIINALPFPALDGGRILFLIIEKIKGHPVRKEIEGTVHYIGFALLMLLVAVVTFRDIAHYADKFKMLWERLVG